jgi:hypothetical protein
VLVCVAVVAGVVAAHVTLGAVLGLIYVLLPSEMIDDGIRWMVVSTRTKFEQYFQKVEAHLRETFPVHEEHPIPPSCLLLWHPHSLLSVTAVLHTLFRITPSLESNLVCHSIYHQLPVVKDLARVAQTIPASHDDMKHALDAGNRVSVLVGGVREMLGTEPKTIRLILGKRRGVFRLALMTGRPLVPIITYGESELFPAWNHPTLTAINSFLYSTFRIAIPLTSWTALSNWVQLYWHPLNPIPTHVGAPLEVKMNPSPTEEDIVALRTAYIAKVKELFDATRPEGTTLIIQE